MRITVPTSANATAIEHPNNCMRHLILFYPIGVVWANSPHTTKQNKRLTERESKEHRMFVRPFVVGGFRRRAAAENMWAVAESCFASVIPKRLTHTNTESLSLARTLSRHFALYFSLLVLVFMPSPQQEKTCSRRIECLARRIDAMLSVASCVVSLVATVTTSSSAYGILCTSSSSWSPSHSSSSLTLLIVVTVHTRRRRHCCRSRRRRRFFCGPYSHKKKSSYSSAVIGSKAAN